MIVVICTQALTVLDVLKNLVTYTTYNHTPENGEMVLEEEEGFKQTL
jgi:hypothetical protein